MNPTYQIVTDRIVSLLEQGVVPWSKTWQGTHRRPVNARGIAYRGVNVFILSAESIIRGYGSNIWMTYKQAQAMKGNVKKGEKSTYITFWKRGEAKEHTDPDTGRVTKKAPIMLRYYKVFNLDQTEGVILPKALQPTDGDEDRNVIDEAEAVVASYLARDDAPRLLPEDGDECYYVPIADTIQMPKMSAFKAPDYYYAAIYHELAHSTGHAKRLDRKATDGFSHGSYGKEELVAEMTDAFLTAVTGIEVEAEYSAAYVNNWLEKIKGDNTLLVKAASEAQRAADYILGTEWEN